MSSPRPSCVRARGEAAKRPSLELRRAAGQRGRAVGRLRRAVGELVRAGRGLAELVAERREAEEHVLEVHLRELRAP